MDCHNTTVNIASEQHNQAILFLTGLAAVSPCLSYKSFTEPLSKNFKVITIEPYLSSKIWN